MNLIHRTVFAMVLAGFGLAGCEGVVTGEREIVIPVTADDSGAYGPVTITLSPEMSPIAINLKAQHGDDPAEVGKWNTYHATLSRNGSVVVEGVFNINHTGTPDTPMGATYVTQTMLRVMSPEAGDYDLRIVPAKPLEIKLTHTEVEVRRNVRIGPGNP